MPAQDLSFFPNYLQKVITAADYTDADGTQFVVNESSLNQVFQLEQLAERIVKITDSKVRVSKIRRTEDLNPRNRPFGLISLTVEDSEGNVQAVEFDLNRKHYANDNVGEEEFKKTGIALIKFLKENIDDEKFLDVPEEILSELAQIFETFATPHSILFDLDHKAWALIHNPEESSVLGKGSSAEGRLAQDLRTGKICAAKIIGAETLESMDNKFQSETEILDELGEVFGTSFRISQTPKKNQNGKARKYKGYIFIEYLQNFFEQIETHAKLKHVFYAGATTPSAQLLRFAVDTHSLLSHLVSIHNDGIGHFDIKPENVGRNVQGFLRFFDFGFAKRLTDPNSTHIAKQKFGSPLYVAPEILLDVPVVYNKAVDIYSLGKLFFEMMPPNSCGVRFLEEVPFGENTLSLVYRVKARSDFVNALNDKEKAVFANMIQLINLCGSRYHRKRPSSNKLLIEWVNFLKILDPKVDLSSDQITMPAVSETEIVAPTASDTFVERIQAPPKATYSNPTVISAVTPNAVGSNRQIANRRK